MTSGEWLLITVFLLWVVSFAFVICCALNKGQESRPEDDEHWLDEFEADYRKSHDKDLWGD